jgi:DNA mismatch endonuclease (patch repair protein)
MVDTVSKATRSLIMSKVPRRDTSLEIRVRKALHKAGLRFRLHRSDLPGTPDIVMPSRRTAIFVHGCFWHGHGCKRSHPPSSNQSYWLPKIKENQERDREKSEQLNVLGWRTAVIWECEIDAGIRRILDELIHNQRKVL